MIIGVTGYWKCDGDSNFDRDLGEKLCWFPKENNNVPLWCFWKTFYSKIGCYLDKENLN